MLAKINSPNFCTTKYQLLNLVKLIHLEAKQLIFKVSYHKQFQNKFFEKGHKIAERNLKEPPNTSK